MSARKSLKDKLAQHNADEAAENAVIKAKFAGRRAADILRANETERKEAGITNVAEHPDLKAMLGGAKPDAGGKKGAE